MNQKLKRYIKSFFIWIVEAYMFGVLMGVIVRVIYCEIVFADNIIEDVLKIGLLFGMFGLIAVPIIKQIIIPMFIEFFKADLKHKLWMIIVFLLLIYVKILH